MAEPKKIIYFIGAGASYGAGATAAVEGGGRIKIPTQLTFWETFLRFCRHRKNKQIIEKFLFRYFLGYRKVPSRTTKAARWSQLSSIDVEEVFTFLSERIQAPSTTSQFRKYAKEVWWALTSEIGNVFSRFPANAATKKAYKGLLDRHYRRRDVFVSFNYDLVLEGSFPKKNKYMYEKVDAERRNAIRVLKPHGSINWQEIEGDVVVRNNPERCLVVAPTHLKFVGGMNDGRIGYLDQSERIKDVWESMESHMKDAHLFVFVGYSFPIADLYFSSVLRSVLAVRPKKPRVVVVNPDAKEISERLWSRFSIGDIIQYYDFSTFLASDRKSILAP